MYCAAEDVAAAYLEHVGRPELNPYRRQWKSIRCHIARYDYFVGDTDGCSDFYTLEAVEIAARQSALEVVNELAMEDALISLHEATQSTTVKKPRRSERLKTALKSCIARRSLYPRTRSSRSTTIATYAAVSTDPHSYAHSHRDDDSYRSRSSLYRGAGVGWYNPGRWASGSSGLLETSGYGIDNWGTENDSEVGDKEREKKEAEKERKLRQKAEDSSRG